MISCATRSASVTAWAGVMLGLRRVIIWKFHDAAPPSESLVLVKCSGTQNSLRLR